MGIHDRLRQTLRGAIISALPLLVLCAEPASGAEPHVAEALAPAVAAPSDVFRVASRPDAANTMLHVDHTRLIGQAHAAVAAPISLELPIEGGVRLSVSPFRVTRDDTRFVVGRLGAADEPLSSFSPASVTLLRGSVRTADGATGHAFFALNERNFIGTVTVNDRRFELNSTAPGLRGGEVLLRPAPVLGDPLPPDVPFCATDTAHTFAQPLPRSGEIAPRRGMHRLELAIETDYEYFARFNDSDAAAFYVTALYGAISDIYIRDFNTRLELTFVRLWDNPADMFNETDPLTPFRNWWESNMGFVPRDAAQFLTGRRNLPYGGVAWLGSICTTLDYSVAGLINGMFDTSLAPGSMQWDIIVAAHELGHNCGTAHTQDYGFDNCYPHPGVEQRGTIMSYCHTQNGGVANSDVRFHAGVQDIVIPILAGSACIDDDCNANSVADAQDIAAGTSPDTNFNGVPDECEDCNFNGILDAAEILGGAADVDGDGVPDVCQPDCNSNGLPDAWEISMGFAVDANANLIPDVCEPDCDASGVADHVQIRADMHLDVNRNLVLDACEDCEGSGTPDLEKLAGAHELWVVGSSSTQAHAYHADTGALRVSTSGGTISEAQAVLISPAGNVLVASGANWRVIEYDRWTGAFIRNLVSTGDGGLRYPAGLAYGADGHLYVSSRDTDAIFKFDGASGAFIAQFVLPNVGGLNEPYGLVFGPNGSLFVASGATNQVLEYDGATGAFIRAFVTAGSGGLNQPRGLTFKHDGNLLVASRGNGRILEYARDTGAFVGVFNQAFSTVNLNLNAFGLAVGAHGNIYVSRNAAEYRIFELEAQTGIYLQSFVRGPFSGLNAPTGIAVAPGFATDCNRNQIPDSCEILSGAQADADTNGVPDVCQVDCDANGEYDWLEIIPRGSRLDCNLNGVLDDCEYAGGHPAPGACVTCSASGDFDNDGDHDLLDAYYFTQCIGADVTLRTECACANLDDSNTLIDAADWTLLESVLSGPQ